MLRLLSLASFIVIAGAGAFAGAADSRNASADHGVLQRFAPRSATTWWAIVASNLHAKVWVVRTTDSGRRWRAVTPPVKLVASSAFLGTRVAWIEADSLHAGAPGASRTEPLYRTLDGGRSWVRVARVASECQLDFVDRRHGWCTWIGAALGSSGVSVYRTSDGGSTWKLVSRTARAGGYSTPGALPPGCDKTIGFTLPRVGWAAGTCSLGVMRLYRSTDGGSRWLKTGALPIPKGRLSDGSTLSLPAVHGSHLAVSIQTLSNQHGTTLIATSANGGRSWHSRFAPGRTGYGEVDLVDVRHWMLSNGTTLLATSDAGRHWHSLKTTAKFVSRLGTPLTPDFLSPRIGFAGPNINGGPMWWTHTGGMTWKRIKITAGPFTLR